MTERPDIASIAALIGDPARAGILLALLAGRALTATELAGHAGVTKQTASAHLGKLVDAQLLRVERQGRHRYFRLADPDVAQVLERLLNIAQRTGVSERKVGPHDPALRRARVCYDHLAGELAVLAFDSLLRKRLLRADGEALLLTRSGRVFFVRIGIDLEALESRPRPLCRPCLDWSMRRPHLAGALGASLLAHFIDSGWARRVRHSRTVLFTIDGERRFSELFKC